MINIFSNIQTSMDAEYARIEAGNTNRSGDRVPDHQIVKTHYPRDNNSKVLSFSIQEEPLLSLDFTSIQIGCRVKIPTSHFPENGLSMKLFKNINIEINSQLITSVKTT